MTLIRSLWVGTVGHFERWWTALSGTQRLMARGLGVLSIALLAAAAVGLGASTVGASDAPAYTGTALRAQLKWMRLSLDTTAGELEIARLKLRRAEDVLAYSARYQIPADLASLIYDTALKEGIDPDLAFRLVEVESRFRPRAQSPVGAYGLAQIQLMTARFYDPDITIEELLEPATNLTIGFRYLRDLLEVYGDTQLALLAYNRGPSRLKQLQDEGRDPRNGYAARILEGYGAGR